ncbi:MAG TPA: hypothetical protein VGR50_08165, partial [Terriglobales bacterium]|nr:hypothetical protein [Terriglobales bacterium]
MPEDSKAGPELADAPGEGQSENVLKKLTLTARPATHKEQRAACRNARNANQRRNRNIMVLRLIDLNRTHVHFPFFGRVLKPAVDKRDQPDNQQNCSGDLHNWILFSKSACAHGDGA